MMEDIVITINPTLLRMLLIWFFLAAFMFTAGYITGYMSARDNNRGE